MKPEEAARQKIDRLLSDSGWTVVSRKDYSPILSAAAIEEGLLAGGLEADYLLFLDGKAIGVLEAKRESSNLSEIVQAQAENYAHKLLDWYQTWRKPLPLIYLSNGREILFKNLDDPSPEYVSTDRIRTPSEIKELFHLSGYYAGLPSLPKEGQRGCHLRSCQREAITRLEASLRLGYKKALIVLATGAGKTFTACMAAYRLLAYTPARRILFLVDRTNLGKQAEGEFGTFRLTENGEPFTSLYATQRLPSSEPIEHSELLISTIQRLYSTLTGQELPADADEERAEDEERGEDDGPPVEVSGKTFLPPDFFDAIIVDECHRSIYGRWKGVLNYFKDALVIGLTATPIAETLDYFNKNKVVHYTLSKSITDGINVDHRDYRIKTEATELGGIIPAGTRVKKMTKRTQKSETLITKEETVYQEKDLDRSVVNEAQIETILTTFRDAVYTDLYPEREPNLAYLPKTLIFAKSDAHASDIVRIGKKVFAGQSDQFIQKITYSAGDSNELIRRFRNDADFRIAVTVTLVATGTDVKPLEILFFMRDVKTDSLYTQMVGRGVRTIGDDQLRNVTPNARSKDHFYIVDAVGVTEHEHQENAKLLPELGAGQGVPGLEKLLEKINHGYLPDDYLRGLASQLARIHKKSDEEQRQKFDDLAHINMKALAESIYDFLENPNRDPFIPSGENRARKTLVLPLTSKIDAQKYLLDLAKGFLTILSPGSDKLISAGFNKEEAQKTTEAFEDYISAHRDEIEALRLIYHHEGEKITYALLLDLEEKLKSASLQFTRTSLWQYYTILHPQETRKLQGSEQDVLTNLIQLVRFAIHEIPELYPLPSRISQFFELWLGQNQREKFSEEQKQILREIIQYVAANGAWTCDEIRQNNDMEMLAKIKRHFKDFDRADQLSQSMTRFIFKT